jgi:arylsulfatase A-like enzyme
VKTILVLFDSLNRRALSCYGGPVPTPNFDRLAARSMVFDSHFVGSMPCMPARRDLQTGRLNFLHRSWGPLEPFDRTVTGEMTKSGIHSHLVTDHYHYFETGGATYHTEFTSWEFIRGQEADPWNPKVAPPLERYRREYHPDQVEETREGYRLQGALNRDLIRETPDFPCVQCFDSALSFLDLNREAGDWHLQIETFDPHEPFHAPPEYRARFATGFNGPKVDWPRYRTTEGDDPAETAEMRANYAALVALCDDQLGRLLDWMDATGAWEDTALIVTTDHGFLLGEHGWWGKNRAPFYNEIAHIPLMIHAPGRPTGRSAALSQNIDIAATLLDLHGLAPPETMLGRSLLPCMEGAPGRDLALYGIFGGAINATDGRHSYFRYPPDMEAAPLFEYTLMPQHSTKPFAAKELASAELHPGFDFTGVPVLKIPALPDAKRPPTQGGGFAETRNALYDLAADPGQTAPLHDAAAEARFCTAIAAEMRRHDAPPELYDRFDLGRAP